MKFLLFNSFIICVVSVFSRSMAENCCFPSQWSVTMKDMKIGYTLKIEVDLDRQRGYYRIDNSVYALNQKGILSTDFWAKNDKCIKHSVVASPGSALALETTRCLGRDNGFRLKSQLSTGEYIWVGNERLVMTVTHPGLKENVNVKSKKVIEISNENGECQLESMAVEFVFSNGKKISSFNSTLLTIPGSFKNQVERDLLDEKYCRLTAM